MEGSGVRPAQLRVISPVGQTRVYVLEGMQYSVGRQAPNHEPDIVLDPDPQGWVSRLHCLVDFEQGQWWVTDHGRNGTLLQHDVPDAQVAPVRGRELLRHGDTLLILGDMAGDRERLYWKLTYIDSHGTQPAPVWHDTSRPGIRYDWVASQAYRVEGNRQTLIEGLRPKGHQLLRYMVSRSDGRQSEAVACDHAELIAALWDSPEGGAQYADKTDLAGVVRAVRLRIEPDPPNPKILETVPTIGYRLYVCPEPVAEPPGQARS
ncbi:FHA domain-containing protein [Streptomyces sp. 3N207]|uniref:FHA domain-containing protein n=1 Tax=Streptomyces sp. 3N207 TaxID=3457417 RepID=UPI003FD00A0B